MEHKPHVSETKKKAVADFAKLLKEYPIIGIVNMANLPTKQLQKMRGTLRTKVVLLMNKRRLMKLAIEKVKADKPGIEKLEPYLGGMPAMLFTKDDPFLLAKVLNANKSNAPIKPGQVAPNDIWVKEGPTPFAPGPVIGELGAAGIKAGIEGGKVKIMKDSMVAAKGTVVKKNIADILTRLSVEPVEIGLDLVAVYEKGEIITKDILFIDEKEYIAKIVQAHSDSMAVALEVGYVTPETLNLLLSKAQFNAHAVALKGEIMTEETKEELLAKAGSQAAAVESKIDA
jgi:large subunit ribosomal protein L10